MKKRSQRSAKKSAAIKLEEVFVKQEPDKDFENSAELEPKAETSLKTPIKKYIRSRGTQVSFDEIVTEFDLPSVVTKSAPIVTSDLIVPQCRFCLHRMSMDKMSKIFNKVKSKANTAFRFKVYVNDSYPYACLNCLNLMDIMLTFKESVMKANHMLQTERTFLEADGWDEPGVMKLVADCRAVVEQFRERIDSIYIPRFGKDDLIVQGPVKSESAAPIEGTSNYEETIEEPNELVETMETDVYIEHLLQDSTPDAAVVDAKNEPEPNLEEEFNDGDEFDDFDDESEDNDFKPSKIDIRESNSDEDENNSSSDGEKKTAAKKTKTKRKKSTNQTPKEPKKYDQKVLCDLCGERIYSTTAESHRNKHLGIRPYTCPKCPLTFQSSYNLSFHVKRLHPENGERSHECDICGSIIQGPLSALKYHKKRHNQEKKHVCTICGKGFTMISYLRQHVQAHGDFPHKCQYCGKR
ncbi:conserved hypothetical protein [Culex quinquefasciatus]|uniref:C2H2-type domain-containing protein n=1 Tax=Culex quinquefasciatus TaxID=7176 RepID=B0WMJ6_CULQU|nr:conserved hypothetical protein [Culex quinquefasciatus]|eukprot:XP_001849930.1 conserved hypothetical protein [Culex quinquefasciatus]